MKQDARTGLWVPDDYQDRTVFPPVLNTFDDVKPPQHIVNVGPDSYGSKFNWWGAEPPRTTAAVPPKPTQPPPRNRLDCELRGFVGYQ